MQAIGMARFCGIELTQEQIDLYVKWRKELPSPEGKKWMLSDQRLLAEVMKSTGDQVGYQQIVDKYPNIFE